MPTPSQRIDVSLNRLSPAALQALEAVSAERTYPKGAYLLRAGELNHGSFTVLEGMARKYYLHDGKEHTTEIYFPGDLAVSFTSYVLQTPADEDIQALTDLRVSFLDYDRFQALKQRFPELVAFDLVLTETYTIWLEERLRQFRTLSAPERYARLYTSHPDYVRHIPLTHLASYLGVTLETLSRIRARKT